VSFLMEFVKDHGSGVDGTNSDKVLNCNFLEDFI
jgi:hypothetical protein